MPPRNEKHSFFYHWYDRMYITFHGRRAIFGISVNTAKYFELFKEIQGKAINENSKF